MVNMILWAAFGCFGEPEFPLWKDAKPTLSAEDLTGTHLTLLKVEGYEPASPEITLGFYKEGWMSSSAGCNSASGQFSIQEGILKLSNIQTTQMLCLPPPFEGGRSVHGDEAWISTFLLASPTIALQDGLLILSSGEVTLTFGDGSLLPPEDPHVSFYDTVWMMDTFINTETALLRLQNGTPSVLFSFDGRVEVNTGCNRGVGKYSVLSDSITIHVSEFTKAVCAPEALQQMDQFLQDLFWGPELSVEKNNSRLTLKGKKGGLTAIGTSAESE